MSVTQKSVKNTSNTAKGIQAFLCLILAGTLFLSAGCAKISVRTVSPDTYWKLTSSNAVNSNKLSHRTTQYFRQHFMKNIERSPNEVIAELKRLISINPEPDPVFALSEVCYLYGKKFQKYIKTRSLDYYADALLYSYYYLFDDSVGALQNPFDPQTRTAVEIYNRSLTKILSLKSKTRILENGKLQSEHINSRFSPEIRYTGFIWDEVDFSYFLLSAEYEIAGLMNQYRTFGLGVPLIAVSIDSITGTYRDKYIPTDLIKGFPATAFLTFDSHVTDPPEKQVKAVLEVFATSLPCRWPLSGVRIRW